MAVAIDIGLFGPGTLQNWIKKYKENERQEKKICI